MAELKTKETAASVEDFLNQIEDDTKRRDCFAIAEIMKKVTGHEPRMWGTAIVGFDSYRYKYPSGHQGEMCKVGFSPRKQNISLYLTCSLEQHKNFLEKLGKHKGGVGCLYIKKLEDVDTKVLEQLIRQSIKENEKRYPQGK